jgi:hypothetical protein
MKIDNLPDASPGDLEETLYRVTQILCPGKAELLLACQSKTEPWAETVECEVIPFPGRSGFF